MKGSVEKTNEQGQKVSELLLQPYPETVSVVSWNALCGFVRDVTSWKSDEEFQKIKEQIKKLSKTDSTLESINGDGKKRKFLMAEVTYNHNFTGVTFKTRGEKAELFPIQTDANDIEVTHGGGSRNISAGRTVFLKAYRDYLLDQESLSGDKVKEFKKIYRMRTQAIVDPQTQAILEAESKEFPVDYDCTEGKERLSYVIKNKETGEEIVLSTEVASAKVSPPQSADVTDSKPFIEVVSNRYDDSSMRAVTYASRLLKKREKNVKGYFVAGSNQLNNGIHHYQDFFDNACHSYFGNISETTEFILISIKKREKRGVIVPEVLQNFRNFLEENDEEPTDEYKRKKLAQECSKILHFYGAKQVVLTDEASPIFSSVKQSELEDEDADEMIEQYAIPIALPEKLKSCIDDLCDRKKAFENPNFTGCGDTLSSIVIALDELFSKQKETLPALAKISIAKVFAYIVGKSKYSNLMDIEKSIPGFCKDVISCLMDNLDEMCEEALEKDCFARIPVVDLVNEINERIGNITS